MADDGSEESRVCSAQQEAWWSSRPEGSGAGGARVGRQMIPRWEEAAGFGGWLGEGIEEGHGGALVGGLDRDEIPRKTVAAAERDRWDISLDSRF